MSTSKVRNYNLCYEMMLAAVKEYEKFITGGGLNNQLFAYGSMQDDVFGERVASMNSSENAEEETIFKEIATRILDRTTGVYFTDDLVQGKALHWEFPSNFEKYVEIYHDAAAAEMPTAKSNTYLLRDYAKNHTFYFGETDQYKFNADGDGELLPGNGVWPRMGPGTFLADKIMLKDILRCLDPAKLSHVEDPEDKEAKKKAKSEEKPQMIYALSREASKEIPWFVMDERYPINMQPSTPDKHENPSVAAYVMKHHKLGMPGKKANHLSVFFGGITALEMSRCTPFINLIIMHEGAKNSPNKKKLNQTSYMRFVRDDDGVMKLDASIYGIGGVKPKVPKANVPEYATYDDMNMSTEYSFMDIFTSPQTMANANINGKGSFDWLDKKKGARDTSYNASPVLDPIQPFLSLNSLNVTIAGAGFGIMATKVASLELTLHDRSRMKEIAPLIASDTFSSTKIRVEYGWTHPDAGPLSTNTIGNYIDGLRDVGIYTVHGSDYSFSGGNTVNISLKLSAAGYAESKSCPAACGPVAPLNMFKSFIDRALESYIAEKEAASVSEAAKKKFPEIRSIVKARGRTAKSPDALISWGQLREFLVALKDPDKDALVKKMAKFLKLDGDMEDFTEGDVQAAIEDDDYITKAQQTAQQWLYAKMIACEPGRTPDPFAHSLITNCLDTEKIAFMHAASDPAFVNPFPPDAKNEEDNGTLDCVSLGKLCMQFIGAPLASCGLYDEVQVMFYPLNHQAGGARKHTTASFPIEYKDFEDKMQKVLANRSRLTVSAFFGIVDKMVRDSYSRAVYGFSGMSSKDALDNFNNLDSDEKRIKEAVGYYKKKSNDIHKDEKKSLAAYKSLLSSKLKTERTERIPKIYAEDGVSDYLPAEDKFVKPNLSLYYEVLPVIDPVGAKEQDDSWKIGIKISKDKDKKDSDGFKVGKTVLRVHIFDEEAVSDPATMVMGSVIYEGNTGEIIGNIAANQIGQNAAATEVAVTNGQTIVKAVQSLSFGEIKQYIKRAYPSITYGASTGTVNSINVSGNTSGQLSNVLMVENYMNNAKGATAAAKGPTNFEEVVVFPSSISVNMMGMPLLYLGENMFIDFNTDTSLDNIYTVKSVGHSIEAGKFQTNVELVASNQGAVKAFRNQMTRKLDQIMKLPE